MKTTDPIKPFKKRTEEQKKRNLEYNKKKYREKAEKRKFPFA